MWLAAAIMAALPLGLHAQSTSADIVGTVTDASGSVVAGATVTLTDVDTHEKRTITTNGDGQYTFNLLKPDRYTVSITATGYSTSTIKPFHLSAGDRAREDSALAIGTASQQVEVDAQHAGHGSSHPGAAVERPQLHEPGAGHLRRNRRPEQRPIQRQPAG
jgi:uncharacterized surface anchored protein